jgi:hypothetical protein
VSETRHIFLVCVNIVNEVCLYTRDSRLMHVTKVPSLNSDNMHTIRSKFEEKMQLLGARNSVLLHIVNCEITHEDPPSF